jgi:hypothetical protein
MRSFFVVAKGFIAGWAFKATHTLREGQNTLL